MSQLDDLKFFVNNEALSAIDTAIQSWLISEKGIEPEIARKAQVSDQDLPALLPAIEVAMEAALRRVSQFLPENLAVPDDVRARTAEQLAQSLARVSKLEAGV